MLTLIGNTILQMLRSICTLALFTLSTSSLANTEVHFSPKGGCEQMIVSSMDAATKTIDAAVYSFNNPALAQALLRAKKRGVKVRLLLDRTQASGRTNTEILKQLLAAGIDTKVHSKHKIEHNKFGIFDQKKVTTGSFNWTKPAQISNSENCVKIDDPKAVLTFHNHFQSQLWVNNTLAKSQEKIAAILNVESKRKPAAHKK